MLKWVGVAWLLGDYVMLMDRADTRMMGRAASLLIGLSLVLIGCARDLRAKGAPDA